MTLKNIGAPATLGEYFHFFVSKYGRFAANPFVGYFMTSVFGDNVMLWRVFSAALLLSTATVMYHIMRSLRFAIWLSLVSVASVVLSIPQYLTVNIFVNYILSELFFVLAVLAELKNHKFKMSRTIIASVFVFLSLFSRELVASSFLVLFFVVLFWNSSDNGKPCIRFGASGMRILPHVGAIALYVTLFFAARLSVGLEEYAYSGMVSLEPSTIFARSFMFLVQFFSLNLTLKYGAGLFLFFSAIAVLPVLRSLIFKGKSIIASMATFEWKLFFFRVYFALLLLIPTALTYSVLAHRTSSILPQFFAVFVFYATAAEISIISLKGWLRRGVVVGLSVVLFGILLVQLLLSFQVWENAKCDNNAHFEAVGYVSDNLREDGIVALSGFEVEPSYAFVADVFMDGRTDNIRYVSFRDRRSIANIENRPFIQFVLDSFNSADPVRDIPDLHVYYNTSFADLHCSGEEVVSLISEKPTIFPLVRKFTRVKTSAYTYIITAAVPED
jgi:hypothetical protein